MLVKIWDVACIGVLCVILTLGLWPFHSPGNNVGWLPDRPGLHFGRPATVFGSNAASGDSAGSLGASLEVWLQPEKMHNGGTFLTLYRPEVARQFSLCQSLTDLELLIKNHGPGHSGTARVYVEDVFRRKTPVFITISSNEQGLLIYIDSILVRSIPNFRLSTADLAGRVILGDAPQQTRSWTGQFLGLAFYEQALMPHQVLRHYESWTGAGRPAMMADDRGVALYLFDEGTGKVIHSRIGSGHLDIPEKYTVLDKIRLEPVWEEFEMSWSYWGAAGKNIIGFVPLGLCFYGYWLMARPLRRPVAATMLLGAAVSFTIEFLQSYLPTRESGMTDLITNTAGTAIGILLYRVVTSPLSLARHTTLVPRL